MPPEPRERCTGCSLYKVLNTRHIVDGKPYKSCSAGEVPETCREDTTPKPESPIPWGYYWSKGVYK